MIARIVLQTLLALLAAYHLGIGMLSLFSFRRTMRFVTAFYGIQAGGSPQLRYALRMLGLYGIALGVLLAFAAWSPPAHQEIIVVVAGLQLARAACRVVMRHELAAAFGISARRNAFNAVLLFAQATALLALVPTLG